MTEPNYNKTASKFPKKTISINPSSLTEIKSDPSLKKQQLQNQKWQEQSLKSIKSQVSDRQKLIRKNINLNYPVAIKQSIRKINSILQDDKQMMKKIKEISGFIQNQYNRLQKIKKDNKIQQQFDNQVSLLAMNHSLSVLKVIYSFNHQQKTNQRLNVQKDIYKMLQTVDKSINENNHGQTRNNIQNLLKKHGNDQIIKDKVTHLGYIAKLSQEYQKQMNNQKDMSIFIEKLKAFTQTLQDKSPQNLQLYFKNLKKQVTIGLNKQTKKPQPNKKYIQFLGQFDKMTTFFNISYDKDDQTITTADKEELQIQKFMQSIKKNMSSKKFAIAKSSISSFIKKSQDHKSIISSNVRQLSGYILTLLQQTNKVVKQTDKAQQKQQQGLHQLGKYVSLIAKNINEPNFNYNTVFQQISQVSRQSQPTQKEIYDYLSVLKQPISSYRKQKGIDNNYGKKVIKKTNSQIAEVEYNRIKIQLQQLTQDFSSLQTKHDQLLKDFQNQKISLLRKASRPNIKQQQNQNQILSLTNKLKNINEYTTTIKESINSSENYDDYKYIIEQNSLKLGEQSQKQIKDIKECLIMLVDSLSSILEARKTEQIQNNKKYQDEIKRLSQMIQNNLHSTEKDNAQTERRSGSIKSRTNQKQSKIVLKYAQQERNLLKKLEELQLQRQNERQEVQKQRRAIQMQRNSLKMERNQIENDRNLLHIQNNDLSVERASRQYQRSRLQTLSQQLNAKQQKYNSEIRQYKKIIYEMEQAEIANVNKFNNLTGLLQIAQHSKNQLQKRLQQELQKYTKSLEMVNIRLNEEMQLAKQKDQLIDMLQKQVHNELQRNKELQEKMIVQKEKIRELISSAQSIIKTEFQKEMVELKKLHDQQLKNIIIQSQNRIKSAKDISEQSLRRLEQNSKVVRGEIERQFQRKIQERMKQLEQQLEQRLQEQKHNSEVQINQAKDIFQLEKLQYESKNEAKIEQIKAKMIQSSSIDAQNYKKQINQLKERHVQQIEQIKTQIIGQYQTQLNQERFLKDSMEKEKTIQIQKLKQELTNMQQENVLRQQLQIEMSDMLKKEKQEKQLKTSSQMARMHEDQLKIKEQQLKKKDILLTATSENLRIKEEQLSVLTTQMKKKDTEIIQKNEQLKQMKVKDIDLQKLHQKLNAQIKDLIEKGNRQRQEWQAKHNSEQQNLNQYFDKEKQILTHIFEKEKNQINANISRERQYMISQNQKEKQILKAQFDERMRNRERQLSFSNSKQMQLQFRKERQFLIDENNIKRQLLISNFNNKQKLMVQQFSRKQQSMIEEFNRIQQEMYNQFTLKQQSLIAELIHQKQVQVHDRQNLIRNFNMEKQSLIKQYELKLNGLQQNLNQEIINYQQKYLAEKNKLAHIQAQLSLVKEQQRLFWLEQMSKQRSSTEQQFTRERHLWQQEMDSVTSQQKMYYESKISQLMALKMNQLSNLQQQMRKYYEGNSSMLVQQTRNHYQNIIGQLQGQIAIINQQYAKYKEEHNINTTRSIQYHLEKDRENDPNQERGKKVGNIMEDTESERINGLKRQWQQIMTLEWQKRITEIQHYWQNNIVPQRVEMNIKQCNQFWQTRIQELQKRYKEQIIPGIIEQNKALITKQVDIDFEEQKKKLQEVNNLNKLNLQLTHEENKRLLQKIQTLQSGLSKDHQNINQLYQRYLRQIAALEQESIYLKNQVQNLRQQDSIIKSQMSQKFANDSVLLKDLQRLEIQTHLLTKENSELRGNNQSLINQVSQSSKSHGNLVQELQQFKKNCDFAHHEIQQLVNHNKFLQNGLEQLNKNNKFLQDETNELIRQNKLLQNEVDQLRKHNSLAQNQLEQLSKHNNFVQNDILNLNNHNDIIIREIQQLRKHNENFQNEVEQLRQHKMHFQGEVEELRRINFALGFEMESVRNENINLTNILQEYSQKEKNRSNQMNIIQQSRINTVPQGQISNLSIKFSNQKPMAPQEADQSLFHNQIQANQLSEFMSMIQDHTQSLISQLVCDQIIPNSRTYQAFNSRTRDILCSESLNQYFDSWKQMIRELFRQSLQSRYEEMRKKTDELMCLREEMNGLIEEQIRTVQLDDTNQHMLHEYKCLFRQIRGLLLEYTIKKDENELNLLCNILGVAQ